MSVVWRTSLVDDEAIEWAAGLMETPMPNLDPNLPATSLLEDLQRWKAEEAAGPGGRPPGADSIGYSVLAVVVGLTLLMITNREVSESGAWNLLVHELTPDQRRRLSMTADLTGTRHDVIAAGLAPGATGEQKAAASAATQQEYARFAKAFTTAATLFDPSPFPRGRRLGSDERKAIADNPAHPDRSIDNETEQRNHERMMTVTNKISAIAALAAPTDGWLGDVACDETIALSHKKRPGVGTRPGRRWSADSDAGWWNGKSKHDPYTGFGYGITYVIRMGRPYGGPVIPVPIGIHVGPPTGGRAAAFVDAHRHAEANGLTRQARDRYAVADNGYTQKDEWVGALVDLGYNAVMDYGRGWPNDIVLPDVDAHKRATSGARILNGCIVCPGAAGVHARGTRIPQRVPAPEPAEAIRKRQRTIDLLQAMVMPVRNTLARAKSPKSGRPRADQQPLQEFTITVQCPATAGLVNCPTLPTASGIPIGGVPTIPFPPFPDQPDLRPRPCRQTFTTYRLDAKQAKHLQSHMHGTWIQEDLYETMRSANERFHSQLKHSKSGGVEDYNWTEVRGIAKRSLLYALATAVTTRNLIRSSIIDAQVASPREIERRRRSKVLAPIKRMRREQRERSLPHQPPAAA